MGTPESGRERWTKRLPARREKQRRTNGDLLRWPIRTEATATLTAELPGLSEKDINLSLSDDLLTISGEKREERQEQEKDKNYHYSERRFGSFRRVVQLPQHIDRDKIEVNFKNGVLNVRLPKSHDARQRQKRIEIKAQ